MTPRAVLSMLVVALLWGAFFVSGKLAVAEAPPLAIAWLRFAAASLLLASWLSLSGGKAAWAPLRREWRLALGLGATGVALYNALAFFGFGLAPASDGAMISPSLNPIVTALLAVPLFGERFGRRRGLALGLATFGIALVFWGPMTAAGLDHRRALGDLCFFGSALAWSAYTLLGKPAGKVFSPLQSTTFAAIAGLVLLTPFAVSPLAHTAWGALTAGFWLQIAFLAAGSTVAAFWLWYDAIRQIGPARAAGFLPLVPVFGVGFGMLGLGERPGALALAGMALAAIGVTAAARSA